MGQGGRGLYSCYPGRAYYPQDLKTEWTAGDIPSPRYMAGRSPFSSDASTSGSAGYIEHTVSKLDTLAGVAIKYGVEVADVKRLNGLTADLQMFALKTLRIPLPGRHPPSAALASPVRSRCESSTSLLGMQHPSSHDSSPHNGVNHRAMEKRPLTSAMGLLRGYYGLASMSRAEGEGMEMATYKSDNESYSEDEPFSPIVRPRDRNDIRRYSTGDRRTGPFGYARESCDNILDTCWSVQTPDKFSTDSGLSTRPSTDPLGVVEKFGEIEVVSETEPRTKERPIRRRAKGEFGSDEILVVSERVNFPTRIPTPRPSLPPSRPAQPVPANGWHNISEGPTSSSGMKTIGAALLGGKGAVEGLISKVRWSTTTTSLQEGGKPMAASASSAVSPAPTGASSVLEGITSAYRRAKAALD